MDRPLILAIKLMLTRQEVGRLSWEKDEQWYIMFNVKLNLQMLRLFVRCILSSFSISGGSPYPKMDGRQILTSLEAGYRMPRPQHVDNKLYEKSLSLLLFLLRLLFS